MKRETAKTQNHQSSYAKMTFLKTDISKIEIINSSLQLHGVCVCV